MHDAGLDLGSRIYRLDCLGEAAQAVNDGDQDVVQAAVLQFVEDLQPELGTLGLLDPQTQHFLAAVGPNSQRKVHRLVLDRAFVANLQPKCVEIHDRIHGLERALLPLLDVGQHLIGNRGNQIRRHLQPVQFQQMALNLANAHAARIHADHVVVEAGQPALILADQLRLERRLPIARNIQLQFAVGRDDRLAARAVAVIAGLALLRLALQVMGQLRRQHALS
ncbi:hypothetical protein WJ70_14060 [Burkholderia ubonensis]|nr:hypothetical protein WJ70_14060 [Burkholderia ubonensis]